MARGRGGSIFAQLCSACGPADTDVCDKPGPGVWRDQFTEYEGDLDQQGLPHGFGTMTWTAGANSGQIYKGEFFHGNRTGLGQLRMVDGSVYDGSFTANNKSGFGRLCLENGSKYEGPFVDNFPHGIGIVSDKAGKKFEEEWENGQSVRVIRRIPVREAQLSPAEVCAMTGSHPDLDELRDLVFGDPDAVHCRCPPTLHTPLHSACEHGNHDIIRFLVKYGADMNAVDAAGSSPLHYAYQRRQAEVCDFLIEEGADTTIRNAAGKMPIETTPNDAQMDYGCPKCGYVFVVEHGLLLPDDSEPVPKCPNDGTPMQLCEHQPIKGASARAKGSSDDPIINSHYG